MTTTVQRLAAVVERGLWITVIGRDGDRAHTMSRQTVDEWARRDGQTVDWTVPMPTIDGRTAYPLAPLEEVR